MESIVGAGSARHLSFDSANRLVCVDPTTPGGCGTTRLHYDVDGSQVLDDRPGGLEYTAYLDAGVRVVGGTRRPLGARRPPGHGW